ncbi:MULTISPECIES: hypothetical protein [unclassified Pseudonocardia]|uniref:hypothetical protein n=1 Tax=unclassified Pseudonocardia TaxID=2619320 RepID=UPI00094B6C56|nr:MULTISPECIES: hypothetical protein [unclassified Pseudonocardia]
MRLALSRNGPGTAGRPAPYSIPGCAILAEVRRAHRVLCATAAVEHDRQVLTVRFRPGCRSAPIRTGETASQAARARLLRELGLASTVVDVPSSVSATEVRDLIRRGNSDPRIAGIHFTGRVPSRVAGLRDEIAASKNIDRSSDGVSDTAHAVMRVVQPFLGRNVTAAVAGADTPLGQEVIRLFRDANTLPITLGRDRDLRIVRQVDVVVGTDETLGRRLGRNLRNTTSLVVHACGDTADHDDGGESPQATLADPHSLVALRTAVFSERVTRTLSAPVLPPWRYVVAGPAGRLTTAMADALVELQAGRSVSGLERSAG